MYFHSECFIIDFLEFSDQIATEVECLTILLILEMKDVINEYTVEKIG